VVRLPLDSLSRSRNTVQISHGKFDHFHRTLAEFTPVDFDSYGLCHHLLARPFYIRLLSSFCSSSRDFARRFLQTQPHDYALALCYSSPLSGSVWTFTSSYQTCVAHKKKDAPREEARPCLQFQRRCNLRNSGCSRFGFAEVAPFGESIHEEFANYLELRHLRKRHGDRNDELASFGHLPDLLRAEFLRSLGRSSD
jgi:hypothetical protein